jgi:hypothetical protein
MTTKLVSFRNAIKYRDIIFQRVRPYIDTTLVGQTFRDFFDDVYGALPPNVIKDAVFESLRLLAGTIFDRRTAANFSWRLGGNLHTLIDGGTVAPWTRQIKDEWVPLQIDAIESYTKKKKPGYILHCVVMAGSPCPMKFSQFVSKGACYAVARASGFTSRKGKIPFVYPEYLTRIVFYGLIDAQRSEERPYFTKVRQSSAAANHNRQILDIRYRLEPCPRSFTHECRNCVLGYNECPAAIRSQKLERKMCPTCNAETYFEQRGSFSICVVCNKSDCVIGRHPTHGT